MRCGRKLLCATVMAAAIFPFGVRASSAQSHAPDPRMLLDLDLFAPANGEGGPSQNSMLDQIRTLRAMGYLNNNVALPEQPAMINQPPPPSPPIAPEDTEDQVTE
jgi:hypothetical protein